MSFEFKRRLFTVSLAVASLGFEMGRRDLECSYQFCLPTRGFLDLLREIRQIFDRRLINGSDRDRSIMFTFGRGRIRRLFVSEYPEYINISFM